MQTPQQALVVVRDQFALKGLSDDALKLIRPAYEQAIRDLTFRLERALENLPPGRERFAREMWLRSQIATMQAQLDAVSARTQEVLPVANALAYEEGLENAKKYLEAGPKVELSGTTTGGERVSVSTTQPGPTLATLPEGEFVMPSVTRQQVVAASREGAFVRFLGGEGKDRNYTLDQVLANWQNASVGKVETALRAGFLSGASNDEISRSLLGLGLQAGGNIKTKKQSWAMLESIVRTSMAEASQSAHDAFFDANEDLLPKTKDGMRYWWDASNDTRLCEVCAPLDGVRFKERSSPPHAWPAHWSCRCKLLPITATLDELNEIDPPKGSFLEATPVEYDKRGKRKPPPPGYGGENSYKRPMRIDGKMQWVRRRDLGPGKTTAGDMLKNANEHSKRMVLGSKARVEQFDKLTGKGGKYEKDPQGALRKMLGTNLGPSAAPPLRKRKS